MDSIAGHARQVVGGVDTHQDLHHAAVVDGQGEILGTRSFATTRAGYRTLLTWLRGHGEVIRVGVEQTGSYGAGLTRQLALAGIPVLGRQGPKRPGRGAARVAQHQTDRGQVPPRDVAAATQHDRRSPRRGPRPAAQPHPDAALADLCRLAPDAIAFRDPVIATKIACKSLARRLLDLGDEIADLDRLIEPLVSELAPALIALEGVGSHNAAELLVTAGDNPQRLTSEAGFAMLCGTSPIPQAHHAAGSTRCSR